MAAHSLALALTLSLTPAHKQVGLLTDALRSVPVLATMPHEALTQLCSVCTYEQFDDDQPIARLGARTAAADGGTEANASHPSRGLCVVLFGEVRLTRRAPSGQTAHVATLHAGDHFGENTLLYKAYRQASARAAARTGLVVVDDSQLRRTLQRAELEQAAERAFFVASVPMFAKLPWERLLRMVGLLKPVESLLLCIMIHLIFV